MTILGIDTSLRSTGYGILTVEGSRMRCVTCGNIKNGPKLPLTACLIAINEKIVELINTYHPDEMAIEAPFFGKNVQSMLKLGRAQGVAITAAIMRDIPIHEYEPRKIKMAITGNGSASKEQVAGMLQRMLHISKEDMDIQLDATDAVGAAYCHFIQQGKPETEKKFSSWADFAKKNQEKIHK